MESRNREPWIILLLPYLALSPKTSDITSIPLNSLSRILKTISESSSRLLPVYIAPAAPLVQTALQVASSGQQVLWTSPCGPNCTYSTSFIGPAYSCAEISGRVPPEIENATAYPENQVYIENWSSSNASLYWAVDVWNDLHDDGEFGRTNATPANIGFWMVYYRTLPMPIPLPVNRTGLTLTDHVVQCNLSSATYNMDVYFNDNIASVQTTVDYGAPVTSGFLNSGQNIFSGHTDRTTTPEGRLSMNLLMINESIMHILVGYIDSDYLLITPSLQYSHGTLVTFLKRAVNNIQVNGTTLPSFSPNFAQ